LRRRKPILKRMETKTTHSTHVILGGGQIGDRLATLLADRGESVRVVQRTARTDARPNVTRLSGDVTDLAFIERATRGASVVYDCMNPQYHQWPERLLPLGAAALHGAAAAGAQLIALDCLYMYGVPDGPMREDSPRNPCSKKGELRVRLEQLRLDADRRGDVRVAIGRASDFFGPAVPQSLFGPRFWQRLFAGKSLECPGDPDQLHTYSYADDVARGLAILGEHPEATGKVWHLPAAPAESTRALFERIAREAGRTVRIASVPDWVWQAAGLFLPFMREAAEMTYQWKVPYMLDDSRFRAAFGVEATPIERAVQDTVRWAVEQRERRAA
jgi:nucleoside-diphosphate-sugar epimerase